MRQVTDDSLSYRITKPLSLGSLVKAGHHGRTSYVLSLLNTLALSRILVIFSALHSQLLGKKSLKDNLKIFGSEEGDTIEGTPPTERFTSFGVNSLYRESRIDFTDVNIKH